MWTFPTSPQPERCRRVFPLALYEFKQDLALYLSGSTRSGSVTLEDDVYAGVGSPDVQGVFGSQLGEEAIPEEVYRQAIERGPAETSATPLRACFDDQ